MKAKYKINWDQSIRMFRLFERDSLTGGWLNLYSSQDISVLERHLRRISGQGPAPRYYDGMGRRIFYDCRG